MKFLINNNTTYNYSYYATRPKWLVEARTQEASDFVNAAQAKSQAGSTKKTFLTVNRQKVKDSYEKHLFQTKELLCWTSDLSFFNLRGYFSNILKALQICRFAVRNNKKILFIKGSGSSNGQGKALHSWLVQYKRSTVPQTLDDLFNKPSNRTQPLQFSQILRLKNNKGSQMTKLINSISKATPNIRKSPLRLKKNTAEEKQNSRTSAYHKYYQLSGLLNRCLNLNSGEISSYNTSHFQNPSGSAPLANNQKTSPKPGEPLLFPKGPSANNNKRKKSPKASKRNLEGQNETLQKQPFRNNFKYGLLKKKTTIRINNVIKLWIKEAQTMSQQTAAGLTIPLAGFLTNSKTTFNAICNLSNFDFYNSVNSNLKSNSLLNEEICEIRTNRLERVEFQKNSGPLFSESLANNLLLTTTKDKRKDEYKGPNVAETQDFDQREWWVDYSNNHYYLPLTPGTRGFKKSISHNKSPQYSKGLCFFGDLLTWQLKSQKRSSQFYTESSSNKKKDTVLSYLKKQVKLDERSPVVLKKTKKSPFFINFKKQLQTFKSLRRKLKGPLKFLNKGKTKEQKKSVFLKKRQFLSRLAKFIVFNFSGHTLTKGQTNRAKLTKVNQKLEFLPSLPTIKTKVRVAINPGNLHKHSYRPAYGYNLSLDTPKRTFNKQNRITHKGRQQQKGNFLAQKRRRLRTLSFYRYYKTIIAFNHLNQYRMFAKTPFINNRLADIIFFINPEKNQGLVNQANGLKIPTVGVVSGNMVSAQGHQGYNNFRLKESVYYPILGNPGSSSFTRAIIGLIVKCLRVEKSKNTLNQG